MEQSYLELFGKRIVSTETRRYVVYPQADKKQYIVCRFSPAAGLLPDSDLSGDIVLLQIEPSGNTKCDLEAGPKETSVVACRVADPSTCTVLSGGRDMPGPCFRSSSSVSSQCRSAAPQIIRTGYGFHLPDGRAARAFRRERNGAGVADSMPLRQALPDTNYGVSLPTLRTLARRRHRRP